MEHTSPSSFLADNSTELDALSSEPAKDSSQNLSVFSIVLIVVVPVVIVPLLVLFVTSCIIPKMTPKTKVFVKMIGAGGPVYGAVHSKTRRKTQIFEIMVGEEDMIETLAKSIIEQADKFGLNDSISNRLLSGRLSLYFHEQMIAMNEPYTLRQFDIVPLVEKKGSQRSWTREEKENATLELRPRIEEKLDCNTIEGLCEDDDDDDDDDDEDMNLGPLTDDDDVQSFFHQARAQTDKLHKDRFVQNGVNPNMLRDMLDKFQQNDGRGSGQALNHVKLPPLPKMPPPIEPRHVHQLKSAASKHPFASKAVRVGKKKRVPRSEQEKREADCVLLRQFKREYKAAKHLADIDPTDQEMRTRYKRAKRRYKKALANRRGSTS